MWVTYSPLPSPKSDPSSVTEGFSDRSAFQFGVTPSRLSGRTHSLGGTSDRTGGVRPEVVRWIPKGTWSLPRVILKD